MRFLLPVLKPFSPALAFAVTMASIGSSHAATVYGSSGTESAPGLLPYIVGNGGVALESLTLYENVGNGISSSIANTDPLDAATWLSSLPSDESRIVSISLGVIQQSVERINPEFFRWIVEQSAITPDRLAIIEGDRFQGGEGRRGGGYSSWETVDYDPSFGSSWFLVETPGIVAIPEPSFCFLGGLGMLSLFRRRR
ncbi:hypothetical protein [Haloferula sargassicola]